MSYTAEELEELNQPPPELVFAPAKPGNEKWLIALVGPSGSGKTYSALRLARGIAGPNGRIGMADTENKRGLFYARDFAFEHADIVAPFRPEKYTLAVERSIAAKHDVLIIDSVSHEWSGLGGLLDWHEAELQRMAGDDYGKRERMTYAAWIKPKSAHKAMLARLLQLNTHVILCLRAEKKIALEKNDKGKLVPVEKGFQPICGKDLMFDMTVSLMLTDEAPGIPEPIKVQKQHRALFEPGKHLDEATGARIAAYARGETVAPAGQSSAPAEQPSSAVKQTRTGTRQPDAPAGQPERRPGRTEQAAEDLIAEFARATTRKQHFAIVENQAVRSRIDWLRANRPPLFDRVNAALTDSFKRTAGTDGDGPPGDDEQPPPGDDERQPPPDNEPPPFG